MLILSAIGLNLYDSSSGFNLTSNFSDYGVYLDDNFNLIAMYAGQGITNEDLPRIA